MKKKKEYRSVPAQLYLRATGLDKSLLSVHPRNAIIIAIKHIAMYQMHRDGFTTTHIAKTFYHQTHVAVLHAIDKIKSFMVDDKEVQILYNYYIIRLIRVYEDYQKTINRAWTTDHAFQVLNIDYTVFKEAYNSAVNQEIRK